MTTVAEYSAALREEREAREARRARLKPTRDLRQKFYASAGWRRLRYRVLAEQGGRCQACGRTAKDGIVIHVDHIKPLSKFWNLRLDKSNLQILCADCNIGKLHLSDEDWRAESDPGGVSV